MEKGVNESEIRVHIQYYKRRSEYKMAKKMPEIDDYKYGFRDKDVSIFRSERGLTEEIVEEISSMKEEPQWMLDFRLKSLKHFYNMPMPQWGGDLT